MLLNIQYELAHHWLEQQTVGKEPGLECMLNRRRRENRRTQEPETSSGLFVHTHERHSALVLLYGLYQHGFHLYCSIRVSLS
jgi:hypothetical protein